MQRKGEQPGNCGKSYGVMADVMLMANFMFKSLEFLFLREI